MRCAWDELLKILPQKYRAEVDCIGKNSLQEIRLRLNKEPQLILQSNRKKLPFHVSNEDISYIINMATNFSPWSAATVSMGYITALGGHRIGICGEAVIKNNCVSGMRNVSSLCIRVARDFPGISLNACKHTGNILILGPPGSGKTTLLRDLIRQRSRLNCGSVGVVDERCELFPIDMDTGEQTDILRGCSKSAGISMLLRTMGPATIAVDEITQKEDCDALMECGWCGVDLFATAHAGNVSDLCKRNIYRPLWQCGLFSDCIVMQTDKSWHWERIIR